MSEALSIPSKWAIISCEYDAKKTCLESTDDMSFQFCSTATDAIEAATKALRSGDKMIALMKIELLWTAAPTVLVEHKQSGD